MVLTVSTTDTSRQLRLALEAHRFIQLLATVAPSTLVEAERDRPRSPVMEPRVASVRPARQKSNVASRLPMEFATTSVTMHRVSGMAAIVLAERSGNINLLTCNLDA